MVSSPVNETWLLGLQHGYALQMVTEAPTAQGCLEDPSPPLLHPIPIPTPSHSIPTSTPSHHLFTPLSRQQAGPIAGRNQYRHSRPTEVDTPTILDTNTRYIAPIPALCPLFLCVVLLGDLSSEQLMDMAHSPTLGSLIVVLKVSGDRTQPRHLQTLPEGLR